MRRNLRTGKRLASAMVAGVLVAGLMPGLAGVARANGVDDLMDQIVEQEKERTEQILEKGDLSAGIDRSVSNYDKGDGASLQYVLPAKYDLRDKGVVTPVKFQNPWGTCWGFAAIAAAETSMLSELGMTYQDTDLDLSELQLAWFTRTPLPEGSGPQAGEGSSVVDGVHPLNTGGLPFTATSVFSQGIGPVTEEMVPYRNAEGLIQYYDGEPVFYSSDGDWSVDEDMRFTTIMELEGSNILPTPAGRDDSGGYAYNEDGTVAIKKELMEGRGVQIGFATDKSTPDGGVEKEFTNTETWAHYTNDPDAHITHAVTIVGWDDDYSASNFLEGQQPPANGAWIVKNSWGSASEEFPNKNAWGNDGYFYLSYYDMSISYPETLDFFTDNVFEDRELYYANAHDYMPSRFVSAASSDTEMKMANAFVAEGDQILRSVACETSKPNVTASYKVYLIDDDETNPEAGTLVAEASETYEYGGFHRTELAEGVTLKEGQRFSVVVTQRTPSGTYSLPIKADYNKEAIDFFAEQGITLDVSYATGIINRGESFLYAGGEWSDWRDETDEVKNSPDAAGALTSLQDYDNFAIKAYSDAIVETPVFDDVNKGDWYESAVNYVARRGIMNGYAGGTTFGALDVMRRQDVACMLFNYFADDDAKAETGAADNTTPFTDVTDGAYYTRAVNWCYENGVFAGYTNPDGTSTTFGVDDEITREAFATVLYRACGSSSGIAEVVDAWPDGDRVSPWAREALGWAIKHGVVSGNNGKLLPQDNALRAEVASMVMRYDELS